MNNLLIYINKGTADNPVWEEKGTMIETVFKQNHVAFEYIDGRFVIKFHGDHFEWPLDDGIVWARIFEYAEISGYIRRLKKDIENLKYDVAFINPLLDGSHYFHKVELLVGEKLIKYRNEQIDLIGYKEKELLLFDAARKAWKKAAKNQPSLLLCMGHFYSFEKL